MTRFAFWSILLAAGLLACRGEEPGEAPPGGGAPSTADAAPVVDVALLTDQGPLANPQSCVDDFDPERDYFPAKVAPRFAERFEIAYFNHFKVVTLKEPWRDAPSIRYLLLLCGTPRPEGHDDAEVLSIPAGTVVTTSSTELPHIVQLGLVDRLLGHDEFDWVSSAAVRQRIESGAMVEVGSGSEIDVERLVATATELFLVDSLGDPERDLLGKLRELGVPVVLSPSFFETSPLGRAEWMLYTALFFNREDRAERLITRVAEHYEELRARVVDVAEQPTVVTSGLVGDVWYMPGGESYAARFLADAGAAYLWADEPRAGSLPLDFESVYARALDADFWIQPNLWRSLGEIRRIDERFADFAAFEAGRVYNSDARLNPHGGNDYWETGTARPDLVLADLIRIFHPDRLPEHQLFFYRRLEEDDAAGR